MNMKLRDVASVCFVAAVSVGCDKPYSTRLSYKEQLDSIAATFPADHIVLIGFHGGYTVYPPLSILEKDRHVYISLNGERSQIDSHSFFLNRPYSFSSAMKEIKNNNQYQLIEAKSRTRNLNFNMQQVMKDPSLPSETIVTDSILVYAPK